MFAILGSILIISTLSTESLPTNLKELRGLKELDVLENSNIEDLGQNSRKAKSLQYLVDPSNRDYMPNVDQDSYLLDFDEQLQAAIHAAQFSQGQDENEISSRARPSRPGKPQSGNSFENSPIYYIRLPPSPYMFVPGMGYVSQPPTLRPPPVQQPTDSPFVNLQLPFVSNAKPTGVYTWSPVTERPAVEYQRPTATNSPITHLDKGPYIFNGRPTDIFLLRDTYNSLYADALQNFYP